MLLRKSFTVGARRLASTTAKASKTVRIKGLPQKLPRTARYEDLGDTAMSVYDLWDVTRTLFEDADPRTYAPDWSNVQTLCPEKQDAMQNTEEFCS